MGLTKSLLFLLIIIGIVNCCNAIDLKKVKISEDIVVGLLGRLLIGNDTLSIFSVKINPELSSDGKLTFTLLKTDAMDVIEVVGSSGVAVAWGAHYYLRKYTSCHISWDGDQITLPSILPNVNVTVQSLDKWMYYQNVCTASYSSVWWDWERWERELDWMALNGINLALAATAQEAIWRRVYDGLGLHNDSFTGPAFLAWGRMGNIRGWGGGLTSSWHSAQLELQHKILQRMRDLGITPVLPAFAGYVPSEFRQVFPSARVTQLPRWNHFADQYCCPDLLAFDDPLFAVVGRTFLREYINEFGTSHIYSCDTFNENDPESNSVEYLRSAAQAVYSSMTETDPEAIWMLQAWAFLSPFWEREQVKAYLTAIPQGSFLILDLQGDLTPLYESYDNFYGQPFIWCTLHNFGGQLGLFGHLERINQGISKARQSANETLVGLGIVPEGIGQNYVMYEFTLEGNLMTEPINLSDWMTNYIRQRYGLEDDSINDAWQILLKTVYNYEPPESGITLDGRHIENNIMIHLPSLSLSEEVWYDAIDVFNAWQLLISGSSNLKQVPDLLNHDLVDTTRQIVQLAVGRLYKQIVLAYYAGHEADVKLAGVLITTLLNDLDPILGTRSRFLLGPWLDAARKLGSTAEEKTLYEWNARNQITLWGPSGEIRDYAAKQWSGMVSAFYLPRWAAFVDALVADVSNKSPYNETALHQYILNNIETPFTLNETAFPLEPIGNTLMTIQNFNQSWYSYLRDIFLNLNRGPEVISLPRKG